jgi:lysyl-tRNA synthetase class 1
MPYQPSFRHLTNVVQICDFDLEKVDDYYREARTKQDREKLHRRAALAQKWLDKYAPAEFRFSLDNGKNPGLSRSMKAMFAKLSSLLKERDFTDKELHAQFYATAKENGVEPREFFRACYTALIGREKGPQLASFILTIGKERVANILSKAVDR